MFDSETFRFLAVNAAAQDFYGYSEAEFLEMTALELRPAEDHERFQAVVRAARSQPRRSAVPQDVEWRCRRKDGSEVDVDVTINAVQVAGRVLLQAVVRDRSERTRDEEERAALQAALLQKQKIESVGRLAGIVAHDFNNLLTVISGYAALVNEEPEATSSTRAKIDQILHAGERARELTDKLLILSRKHPSEPKILDVDEFIRQESRLLPGVLGEQVDVQIALNATSAHVRIDPGQLSQALMNLVLNARDAMAGGGTLAIATRSRTARHAPSEHAAARGGRAITFASRSAIPAPA